MDEASPQKDEGAPEKGGAPAEKGEESPQKDDPSLKRDEVSPQKDEESPEKDGASSERGEGLPEKDAPLPKMDEPLPKKTEGLSKKGRGSPKETDDVSVPSRGPLARPQSTERGPDRKSAGTRREFVLPRRGWRDRAASLTSPSPRRSMRAFAVAHEGFGSCASATIEPRQARKGAAIRYAAECRSFTGTLRRPLPSL